MNREEPYDSALDSCDLKALVTRASMKFPVLLLAVMAGISPLLAAEGDNAPVYTDYLDWADNHGLVGMLAQPDVDIDGDGVTNLMAYAFGLGPLGDPETVWDVIPSLDFLGDPPEPVLQFVLPPRPPADVTYVIEAVLADGTRVEIARKNGLTPWTGEAKVSKKPRKDGSMEITVYAPLDLELPEEGRPLRLRVEFAN